MTTRAGWTRSALLAALAAAGQAASLRLIVAPPYAVYQHYPDWTDLAARSPTALAVLTLQAAVCLALALGDRAGLRAALGPLLRGWRGPLVLALVAFGAAVPAASGARFVREVLLASGVAALAALNLWLAVRAAPAESLRRIGGALESRLTLRGDGDARAWDRALPWVVAAWVTLVAATLAVLVFERLPHIDDSVSYQFQARVMAAGRLWLPAPPDSASFHMDEVIVDRGRWFGYAFPAWPAVLAIGTALGVPWLVNPVLGGATVLLGHALARRLGGRGLANVVVLLLAASPWLLWMSAEFMGHPLSGVLSLAALLAGARAVEDGWRWGALSGLALGLLFLVRPLDGLLVTAVGAVWLVREAGWRRALGPLAAGGLAAMASGALVFPYNAALTGRATYAPHMLWTDRAWGPGVDRLGFGPDIGIPAWTNSDPLAGHGAADVVLNWNKNLFATGTDLFGWTAGSLLLLWLALGLKGWRRADALPAGLAAAFVLAHAAYWFSGGPDLGPRYWYPILVPLVILTARAASLVADRLSAEVDAAPERVALALVIAGVSALLLFMPWRAVSKYYRYREVSGDVRRLAAEHDFGRALVFMRSTEREDYQSAYSLNPTDLDAPVPVYVRDAGATNRARVVASFPDRPVWVIGRRERDVPRVELFEGPLPPGTVPR